jgi:pyruvate dehydrogenase E2 component (dihydrolipoamide acetyltransferase)
MLTPVELPKLGNTVEECIISRWVKHSGDRVNAGETVLEVETDKAVQEIASPATGTLLATFFDEGALVPVFTNLFVIGETGESAERFRPGGESNQETLTASVTSPSVTTVSGNPAAGAEPDIDVRSQFSLSPRARRFAREQDFHPRLVEGSGPRGRVLEEDLRKLHSSAASSGTLREQRDSDNGSHRHTETTGLLAAIPLTPTTALPASRAPVSKLSHIRNRIGQRMRESLATTVQYTLNSSADASGLLTLRARIKASANVADANIVDANINDMVMYCTVQSLMAVPDLNVEFVDGKLIRHSAVHLGFAVDTPRGLIVPVIRDADQLSLHELASKVKELSAKAVQGEISPDCLAGATFTVSNLGGLGIESFTPILNPPQVAILGVNAIQLKPVRQNGVVRFIDAIGLSLTVDHQIIDGAPGARFLLVVKQKIENVESICGL